MFSPEPKELRLSQIHFNTLGIHGRNVGNLQGVPTGRLQLADQSPAMRSPSSGDVIFSPE